MTDEPTIKLTDFDYLTGDHHLQMLKAALPYVNVSEQKILSILIKAQELRRTVSIFDEEETASLRICSLGETASRSPIDMLEAMKPYGTTQEQDFLDLICNFIQGFRLGNQYQEMKMQTTTAQDSEIPGTTIPGTTIPSGESSFRKSPWEQLKAFLPPEQQSRFETMSMLVQAMQQLS